MANGEFGDELKNTEQQAQGVAAKAVRLAKKGKKAAAAAKGAGGAAKGAAGKAASANPVVTIIVIGVALLVLLVFGLLGAGLPSTNFNSTSQVNPGQDTLDETKTEKALTDFSNSKETEIEGLNILGEALRGQKEKAYEDIKEIIKRENKKLIVKDVDGKTKLKLKPISEEATLQFMNDEGVINYGAEILTYPDSESTDGKHYYTQDELNAGALLSAYSISTGNLWELESDGSGSGENADIEGCDLSTKNGRAKYIYLRLRKGGFTASQAAGFLGNFQVETASTFDPNIQEFGSGIGYGIAQWSFDRRKRLEKQPEFKTLKGQVDFVFTELKGKEKLANKKIKGVTGNSEKAASEAATIVEKYYERPSPGSTSRRKANAVHWYRVFKDLDPNNYAAASGSSAASGSGASDIIKACDELAWPLGTKKSKWKKPTPALKKFLNTDPKLKKRGWGRRYGASCDKAVFIAIYASGYDKKVKRNLEDQINPKNWDRSKWQLVQGGKHAKLDRSKFQAGDVIISDRPGSGGHIFIIYKAKAPGQKQIIAEGSYSQKNHLHLVASKGEVHQHPGNLGNWHWRPIGGGSSSATKSSGAYSGTTKAEVTNAAKDTKTYKKYHKIGHIGSGDVKKWRIVPSHGSYSITQSMTWMGDGRYLIGYTNSGGKNKAMVVKFRGKKEVARQQSNSARHINGLCYNNHTGKVYAARASAGGGDQHVLTVFNGTNLKPQGTKKLKHVQSSSIGYDATTKRYIINQTSQIVILNQNFKTIKRVNKKRSIRPQDSNCHNGIALCVNQGSSPIDIWRMSDGKYLGTITTGLGEVESACVNDSGHILLLGAHKQIWVTKKKISDYVNVSDTQEASGSTIKHQVAKECMLGGSNKDENGRYHGGKEGDQTGKEVYLKTYKQASSYHHWTYVYHWKDPNKGVKAAQAMIQACQEDNVGYNQSERTQVWNEAKKKGWTGLSGVPKCNSDCSSLCWTCAKIGGANLDFPAADNTYLLKSGDFEKHTTADWTRSSKKLSRGDILGDGHHFEMVIAQKGDDYADAELNERIEDEFNWRQDMPNKIEKFFEDGHNSIYKIVVDQDAKGNTIYYDSMVDVNEDAKGQVKDTLNQEQLIDDGSAAAKKKGKNERAGVAGSKLVNEAKRQTRDQKKVKLKKKRYIGITVEMADISEIAFSMFGVSTDDIKQMYGETASGTDVLYRMSENSLALLHGVEDFNKNKINPQYAEGEEWAGSYQSGAEAIASKAEELAWPHNTSSKFWKYKRSNATSWAGLGNTHCPTKAFQQAYDKVRKSHFSKTNPKTGRKTYLRPPTRFGASCDLFVGVVVRASGYDKGYCFWLEENLNGKKDPTKRHPEKWTKIKMEDINKYGGYKRGDIIIYDRHGSGGHTFIYLGKQGNVHRCAEAGYAGFYGKITHYKSTKGYNFKLGNKKKGRRWVYRATQDAGSFSGGMFAYPFKDKYILTSKYKERWGRHHDGCDIGAPSGTPILACAAGKVETAGSSGGYGNLVVINHGNGKKTYYGHQSRIKVKVGDKVAQGQVIGYVGSTGRSTGPHLHLGVMINDKFVDPQKYVSILKNQKEGSK